MLMALCCCKKVAKPTKRAVVGNLSTIQPPKGFQQYKCLYGYPPSSDQLLHTYRTGLWNADDVLKDCIVYLNEVDSTKIIISVDTNEWRSYQDFIDAEEKGVLAARQRKYGFTLFATNTIVIEADSLFDVSCVYERDSKNKIYQVYCKNYRSILDNRFVEFCYVKYSEKNNITPNTHSRADSCLMYLVRQMYR